MTAWIEVLTALTDAPDLPIRGTIEELRVEGAAPKPIKGGFAYSGRAPMLVVPGHGCRIHRQSLKTRVDSIDGEPLFISDGIRAWDFKTQLDRPQVGSPDRVIYLGRNQFLVRRRSAAEWAGDDFTQPVGSVETTEFAGRDCWTVRLAPPAGKPHPLRIWVDIKSGHMLGHRNDEVGVGAQFVDLTIGEPVEDDVFVWNGPAYTPEEIQQLYKDQRHVQQQEQQMWFLDHVTTAPLTIRAPLSFKPDDVRHVEAGGFDASNGRTMLARRQRDAEPWSPKWGVLHYAWSTREWDWAAGALDVDLDDQAVTELQQNLHPGESATRVRRVDPPGRGQVR